MQSHELQSLFLDYFKDKKHTIVPSSCIIPYNDDTLLFVNSGMVQFKQYFLSQANLPYYRATSSQFCIRAGGKHNDLDDVGKDSYHHTFFIMLGNWSFGDYFKREAIDYAYDFLINVLKLDKRRMYVSYYSAQDANDMKFVDNETRDLWLRYLDNDRILPFGGKENFWEMGDVGPCGPCTEIHYDCRDYYEDGASWVNKDHPDVIEIWNIVFIEYYRNKDQSLSELKTKCIDTGMGMERVLRIINNYKSNYMTDPFRILINAVESEIFKIKDFKKIISTSNSLPERISNLKLEDKIYEDDEGKFRIYKDVYNKDDDNFSVDMAMRVIADHSRTIAICLHDGVLFNSVGRGYVARRIMRRAIRYCNVLQISNRMHKFIELAAKSLKITLTYELIELAKQEEVLFLKTLEKGKALLYKKVGGKLSGFDAFTLYDTYGFPIDLTEIICQERNIQVDRNEFDAVMHKMKELSRKKEKQDDESVDFNALNFLYEYNKTDDSYKYTENNLESAIFAILHKAEIVYDKNSSSKLTGAEIIFQNDLTYSIITEKTCLYTESGGQVGDTGTVIFKINDQENFVVNIHKTKKLDGYIFHFFKGRGQILTEYDNLKCKISYDAKKRENIMMNHSGTHLLNHTLRKYLNNVEQKGSLVDDQKLRFDYSGSMAIDIKIIKEMEDYMNNIIESKLPIVVSIKKINDVKESSDIIYLKEEKYPENVRVITIKNTSSELCGGTHLCNTQEIKRIRIVSETGISSNVRRIVAVTGDEAYKIEENLKKKNNLDYIIPLYEKHLLLIEKENKEKIKIMQWKENINSNLDRIKKELLVYKEHNILNTSNLYKMVNFGFIFQCDFHVNKNISKDLSTIAMVLDKQKIDGFVYAIIEDTIVFAFRGMNALQRGNEFVEFLGNGTVKGKDTCCNGKALISKRSDS